MSAEFRARTPDVQRSIETIQVTALTAALVFLADPTNLSAEARVECRHNPTTNTSEVVIQREPGEPEHISRFGVVPDLNSTSLPPFEKPTALFLDVTNREVRISGITYTVEDPEAFKAQVTPLINDAKRTLNLSWSSMSEMSPRDLVATSAWIASKKITFDIRLAEIINGAKNPRYDKALAQKVEQQPFDVKIMKGGIGVCRDYASEVTFLSKTIKEIAQSPACKFVHVADLESPYDIHGLNVIFELKNENGKPVIKIYYSDVLAPIDLEKGGPFIVSSLDALTSPVQKFGQTGRAFIAPTLSESDARIVLKCFIDYREQGALNLSVLNGITHSYESSIRVFERSGDIGSAEALAREERAYYRDMIPQLLQELERIAHQPIDNYGKNYQYQKIFAYQILEWMYQRLGENEQRMRVLQKLHTTIEWDRAELKLDFGDTYADQLGIKGDVQGALAVYEELFAGFQRQEPEDRAVFKKWISAQGEVIELEPFASRENFERYTKHKKQEWESGKRRKVLSK